MIGERPTTSPAQSAPMPMTPGFFRPVAESASARPRLHVVVDTEEEFDWHAPFSRASVGVTAIDEVDRLQNVLAPFHCRPTYVIDYPVAATPSSSERLAALAHAGACQIGAHLHPWVNPPYVETVSARHSYACNLGFELEGRKIRELKDTIEDRLEITPRSYKAGRYGFARTTADLLEGIGFDIDLSVNPEMDFRSDGGPSFVGFSPAPGWFGLTRDMLELPCTHGYIGAARQIGTPVHRLASQPFFRRMRAVGVLARTGLLNRVMLSPEDSRLEEMTTLTTALHAGGLRTFALTLHSPSLKPGCTPYVRTAADRDALLERIERYCDFFFGSLGGTSSTPADYFDELRPTGDRNS